MTKENTPKTSDVEIDGRDARISLTSGDKLEISVEVLMQLVPWIGSSLSTSIFGKLAIIRRKRLETCVDELNVRLDALANSSELTAEIQALLQENERFVAFLRNCVERIIEEYDAEKLEAYKNAFISGYLDRKLDLNLKLEFINFLRRFGTQDLHVLGYLSKLDRGKYVEAINISASITDGSELQKLLILSATDTLANMQLIEVGKIGLMPDGTLKRQEHEYRLTALGWSFVSFIGAYDGTLSI